MWKVLAFKYHRGQLASVPFQPEPASRLNSATRIDSFFAMFYIQRCPQNVSVPSNFTTR